MLLVDQAPEISVRKRGKIVVKGKGDMQVYWVGRDEAMLPFEDLEAVPEAAPEVKRVEFKGLNDSGENLEASESAVEEGQRQENKQLQEKWRQNLQNQLKSLRSQPPEGPVTSEETTIVV